MIVRERTVWLCFVMCVATHASENDIGDEGATALASALERNNTLQHPDVSGECCCDAGVCVVCGMCGVWMMMRCDCAREDRVVVFRDVCGDHGSGNGIGVEGATALGSALERNSTLQHLDVGCECLCDAGVCVVCGDVIV